MPKKPPLIFTVVSALNLTPSMIRVTLTAPEIAHMDSGCAGANCKLFLPQQDQTLADFMHQMQTGARSVVRTYTVRYVRTERCEMDIDFVYHGDTGPASVWAKRAKPGSFVGFAGPGLVKVTSFYADKYLVVADMSALPVAAATLEAMPEDAKGMAIFDILSEQDQQDFRIPKGIECHWIVKPDPHAASDAILDMVKKLDWPAGSVQTCIAGESGLVKKLRQELIGNRGYPKDDCYLSGYWKIGLIEDEHQKLKRAEATQ